MEGKGMNRSQVVDCLWHGVMRISSVNFRSHLFVVRGQ